MFSFKSKIILKAFQILQSKYIFTPFPMTPCMRLITCTGGSHHPDYLASTLHTLVAKSCFGTADLSERFPLCVFSCWLPGLFILSDHFAACKILSVCRLPRPFALTLFMNLTCLRYSWYCWLNFACLTSSVLIKLHMDLNVTDLSLHICCQNYCQWQKIVIINIDDTNKL